jgi:hypothetical protein
MTKQIKLETREIMMSTRDESGKVKDLPYKFDFRTELQLIMEAPSPRGDGGTTPGDMFKRLSIIGKLKAAEGKGAVILDDDEYQLLAADLEATKFRIIDQAILDLSTAVKNAEDVEIKEVESKEA